MMENRNLNLDTLYSVVILNEITELEILADSYFISNLIFIRLVNKIKRDRFTSIYL